ncbi:uncharacterized protein OCT59_019736 [Rhizophagus irregularis]|uniref:uncharacterized protein n=1 Tax=Rhizophagus irregularis TaxID=588596 RepID=UPI00333335AB|nr:hypothetical protein OCT59_019736 [Rhizophagus irregularis]
MEYQLKLVGSLRKQAFSFLSVKVIGVVVVDGGLFFHFPGISAFLLLVHFWGSWGTEMSIIWAEAKSHTANGIFTAENRNKTNFKEEIREIEDFLEEDWGDDDDSEWEEDIDLTLSEANYKRLLELELIWKKDAHLEKKTRRPYLTGLTKKSTFYDNYGPSGKWTKAEEGTSKLTSFFSPKNKEIEILTEDDGWNFKGVEVKIEDLKEELRRDQYKMSVIEYNKKRAIFEMLKQIKRQIVIQSEKMIDIL